MINSPGKANVNILIFQTFSPSVNIHIFFSKQGIIMYHFMA